MVASSLWAITTAVSTGAPGRLLRLWWPDKVIGSTGRSGGRASHEAMSDGSLTRLE
jgi:hypothetical protein